MAITYSLRTFAPAGTETLSPGITLAAGFLLVAALQSSHIFARLNLPHLTGYIVLGLICGPQVLGLLSPRAVESLGVVQSVSVELIALLAGCELNLRRLRPRLRAIATYAGISLLFEAVLLWFLFVVIASILPVT